MKCGMTFFYGDEGAAAGGTNFSVGAQGSVYGRAIIG